MAVICTVTARPHQAIMSSTRINRLSPDDAESSRIPIAFRRSRSMRLRGERSYAPAPPSMSLATRSPGAWPAPPFPRISESRESSVTGSERNDSPPHSAANRQRRTRSLVSAVANLISVLGVGSLTGPDRMNVFVKLYFMFLI